MTQARHISRLEPSGARKEFVQMMRLYVAEGGALRKVDKAEMRDVLWIDLVAPSPEEVERLHKEFEIDLQDIADCLDPNERSRLEVEEKYDMLVLRSLLTDERSPERIQTMPIGIMATPRQVITVRIGAAFEAEDLCSDLKRKPRLETKEDLFLAIVRRVHRDIERTLRPMERKIGAIQETILHAKSAEVAHSAFALSNGLILLNTGLLSNLNAISLLARARQLQMTKDQLDLAEDIENDVAQLYEMTTIYREITSNILNAYETAVSNNLSFIMKTLTTISLILILPTLIASLYGMNVALPYQHDPDAFWFVIGISAVCVAGLWVTFRLKKIL
ncbi:MAG: Magnesium transporter CorA family protein [Candidatus Thermoplasmatota archaeon]|nr:Magnesium transporter CorA family protein [Candidatus Thermoplasmatota archaeon]